MSSYDYQTCPFTRCWGLGPRSCYTIKKFSEQGVSQPMICSFNLMQGKKGNTLQGRESAWKVWIKNPLFQKTRIGWMKWTVQSSIWLLYLITASLHWTDNDKDQSEGTLSFWQFGWPIRGNFGTDRVSEHVTQAKTRIWFVLRTRT